MKGALFIYNVLAQYSYSVRYKVMPSNKYGNVPQVRKRIYIVAFLDTAKCDAFKFPEPIPLTQTIAYIINKAERKNDIYYYDEATQTPNKTLPYSKCISNISMFAASNIMLVNVYEREESDDCLSFYIIKFDMQQHLP